MGFSERIHGKGSCGDFYRRQARTNGWYSFPICTTCDRLCPQTEKGIPSYPHCGSGRTVYLEDSFGRHCTKQSEKTEKTTKGSGRHRLGHPYPANIHGNPKLLNYG